MVILGDNQQHERKSKTRKGGQRGGSRAARVQPRQRPDTPAAARRPYHVRANVATEVATAHAARSNARAASIFCEQGRWQSGSRRVVGTCWRGRRGWCNQGAARQEARQGVCHARAVGVSHVGGLRETRNDVGGEPGCVVWRNGGGAGHDADAGGGASIMRRVWRLARAANVGTGGRRRLTMKLSVDGTRDDEAVARKSQ